MRSACTEMMPLKLTFMEFIASSPGTRKSRYDPLSTSMLRPSPQPNAMRNMNGETIRLSTYFTRRRRRTIQSRQNTVQISPHIRVPPFAPSAR